MSVVLYIYTKELNCYCHSVMKFALLDVNFTFQWEPFRYNFLLCILLPLTLLQLTQLNASQTMPPITKEINVLTKILFMINSRLIKMVKINKLWCFELEIWVHFHNL